MTPRNRIGRRITRADCQAEVAREGQYPVLYHHDGAGHQVMTPGIEPGSKVYFTIKDGKKVIRFVDPGRPR